MNKNQFFLRVEVGQIIQLFYKTTYPSHNIYTAIKVTRDFDGEEGLDLETLIEVPRNVFEELFDRMVDVSECMQELLA